MEKPDIELEKAKVLDEVLKIISSHYPKGLASNPVYIKYHLQNPLSVENYKLMKYLKSEKEVFLITKVSVIGGETDGEVALLPEALQRLREDGPWYEAELLFMRKQQKLSWANSKQKQDALRLRAARKKMKEEKQKEEARQSEDEKKEREKRAEEREIARDIREARHKRINWLITSLIALSTLIIGYMTARFTDTSKIDAATIERLEGEKTSLQSQFDELNKKYMAIPDSIR